jgi:hypothetical protein
MSGRNNLRSHGTARTDRRILETGGVLVGTGLQITAVRPSA